MLPLAIGALALAAASDAAAGDDPEDPRNTGRILIAEFSEYKLYRVFRTAPLKTALDTLRVPNKLKRMKASRNNESIYFIVEGPDGAVSIMENLSEPDAPDQRMSNVWMKADSFEGEWNRISRIIERKKPYVANTLRGIALWNTLINLSQEQLGTQAAHWDIGVPFAIKYLHDKNAAKAWADFMKDYNHFLEYTSTVGLLERAMKEGPGSDSWEKALGDHGTGNDDDDDDEQRHSFKQDQTSYWLESIEMKSKMIQVMSRYLFTLGVFDGDVITEPGTYKRAGWSFIPIIKTERGQLESWKVPVTAEWHLKVNIPSSERAWQSSAPKIDLSLDMAQPPELGQYAEQVIWRIDVYDEDAQGEKRVRSYFGDVEDLLGLLEEARVVIDPAKYRDVIKPQILFPTVLHEDSDWSLSLNEAPIAGLPESTLREMFRMPPKE